MQLSTAVVAVRGLLVAMLVLAACSPSGSSDGAASTPSGDVPAASADGPVDGSATPTTVAPVRPDGFTQVTLRVTKSDGQVCELCVWLADNGDERSRGLMGVTDLGQPVGMAFAYTSPTDGRFFMYRTPMPLSIAWFSVTGEFVGSADMEPCVEGPRDDCLRYSPETSFALAVEVPQGELGEHGLQAGSIAEVLFATEGITCPN